MPKPKSSEPSISAEDEALFRQAVAGTRRIHANDRVLVSSTTTADSLGAQRKRRAAILQDKQSQREQATHPFSSQFEPALPEGTMKFTAADANPYLAKQLRRGDFSPELVVDLHGLTQLEAQREIAAAISHCLQQQVYCLNIIHGVGTGVLRQRVPGWLMQHPDVIAFHQAPLEWGGQGAMLVLLKTTLIEWRQND